MKSNVDNPSLPTKTVPLAGLVRGHVPAAEQLPSAGRHRGEGGAAVPATVGQRRQRPLAVLYRSHLLHLLQGKRCFFPGFGLVVNTISCSARRLFHIRGEFTLVALIFVQSPDDSLDHKQSTHTRRFRCN